MPQKVRDVIRRLEDEGWYLVRTRGSHRQYKHPTKPGTVTVPGRLGSDITEKTWQSIQKQAGWR
jgi:predicted RNA binding protein YcfA (HicA-like mRNA interferase family)